MRRRCRVIVRLRAHRDKGQARAARDAPRAPSACGAPCRLALRYRRADHRSTSPWSSALPAPLDEVLAIGSFWSGGGRPHMPASSRRQAAPRARRARSPPPPLRRVGGSTNCGRTRRGSPGLEPPAVGQRPSPRARRSKVFAAPPHGIADRGRRRRRVSPSSSLRHPTSATQQHGEMKRLTHAASTARSAPHPGSATPERAFAKVPLRNSAYRCATHVKALRSPGRQSLLARHDGSDEPRRAPAERFAMPSALRSRGATLADGDTMMSSFQLTSGGGRSPGAAARPRGSPSAISGPRRGERPARVPATIHRLHPALSGPPSRSVLDELPGLTRSETPFGSALGCMYFTNSAAVVFTACAISAGDVELGLDDRRSPRRRP